jgi:hypothetical protein
MDRIFSDLNVFYFTGKNSQIKGIMKKAGAPKNKRWRSSGPPPFVPC